MSVSLLFGRSKVAPTKTTSIPRLELCSAVLSTQAVRMMREELDVKVDEEFYYSDSKVVLGYIQNERRRFYVYVANRVQAIRNVTKPSQWRYIDSANNPADLGTRGVPSNKLMESRWMSGPEFLWKSLPQPQQKLEKIALEESDLEVKREVTAYATRSQTSRGLDCAKFGRFSSWASLRRAIANLILLARQFKKENAESPKRKAKPRPHPLAAELEQASKVIVGAVPCSQPSLRPYPQRERTEQCQRNQTFFS